MSDNWNRIFGTAWEKLSQSDHEVGAFLLDKKARTVAVDGNVTKLLDIRHSPEYDELLSLISIKADDIIIAEDTDELVAGFVVHRSDYSAQSELPVCTKAQFASAVGQGAGGSLLALLQIEDYVRPAVTNADISDVLTAILANTPEGTVLAAGGKNRFWLYISGFDGNKVDYLSQLQSQVRRYISESTDTEVPRSLTFSAGCGADVTLLSERMQSAEFTLYEAAAKGVGMLAVYSDERYEQHKTEYENMRRFTTLISDNLFVYNFQPIVSARDGDIVAYEALMRTDKSINMFPLEVLGAATKLGRLYDIEKATLKNTLEYISKNQNVFVDRKLFVNSIPAHILSYADWEELVKDYGELMEKLVIEMTENSEIDDDKLAIIHDRFRRSNIQLAIDDYGTGYSNTTNLLRYAPDYVKIDRSLIENIHEKPKIQKLVSGIIEFIHENGYSALAEGVETSEELKTMIMLGSDLIQGYYISKPKPFTLHEITESLREEISEINLLYCDKNTKVYHTVDDDHIDLSKLAAEHYGSIFVESESVVIEGYSDTCVNCPIIIKDGITTRVTLKNAHLTTDKEAPVITLGAASELQLEVVGNNEVISRGIWVPQTSTLHLTGKGSLSVKSELTNCYGIGVDKDHSAGAIYIDCIGRIVVEANGENAIGIGGGKNVNGTVIKIAAGYTRVSCAGGNCVAIGNFDGNSVIDIQNCTVDMELSATNAVGIGSMNGKTDIYLAGYHAQCIMSGLSLCGLGSLNDGKGSIEIDNGSVHAVMRGRSIACIGSVDGAVNCGVRRTSVEFDCEGGSVVGIGDITGSGDVTLRETSLSMHFLSQNGIGYGTRKGALKYINCKEDIRINE